MTSPLQAVPKPRYDLVIFDCDGVLVDSEVISCSTVSQLITRHGVPFELERALSTYLGRPAKAVLDDFARLSNKPVPETFVSEWREMLFANIEKDLQPIPGVREAVRGLPVPYCVASSSDEERIEVSLRKTGLWDLFERTIFSTTMVTNGKPAPDLFLLAASRMNCAPERTLVVEDSVSGVLAAKAAGMTACGFTAGSHFSILDNTAALVDAGADYILTSMGELTGHLQEQAWPTAKTHG